MILPFLFLVFTISLNLAVAEEASVLTLVQNGLSEYPIVLPDAPTAVQQTAANELQSYLNKVSGVQLPIVSESTPSAQNSGKRIVIGPSKLSQKLLGKSVKESEIAYDGIVIKAIGDDLVLTGHVQRGMLYAVYTFLENQLGCRFWTPDCETVPHLSVISIPATLDVRYAPKLEYRESHYRIANNGPFAAKMKNNGALRPVPEEFGGHHRFCHFVHSFYPLLPPSKYFEAHPEWYSEVDGKRTCDHAQLCLTNDEMTQELIRNALEDLRENPQATFLSVSQNDWHKNYCHCPNCTKIAEEEGSQSGPLIRFVNKVAEAVEKEFPNVYVETLAYTYTRKPPKLAKPRDNVVVRLCTIECSFCQTLQDGEQNHTLKEDMEGWSKIAKNLFVWDYVTNFTFYLLPHPNYYVLKPNINFFVDHHTIGLFEQGDNHSEAGDFTELRNWVISKLLWNPEQDFDALKDEFVAGYYGPDFVPIFDKYFKIMRREVEQSGRYLGIYRGSTMDWLTYDGLNEATELLNEAQTLAEKLEAADPTRFAGLVSKIRHNRMPIDLVWLKDYSIYKTQALYSEAPFSGPADFAQALDDYFARLDEFKVSVYREACNPIQDLKDDLSRKLNTWKLTRKAAQQSQTALPDVCKNLSNKNWLDVQEDQFQCHKLGEFSFIVEDSAASNGLSVKMGGDHRQWATSWSVPHFLRRLTPVQSSQDSGDSDRFSGKQGSLDLLSDDESENANESAAGRFHVFVSVRCDSTDKTGLAMELGIYDEKRKKNIVYKALQAGQIAGSEFKLLDLGTHELEPGQYFWSAPVNRPESVEAVYTDRLIVIREQ